MAAIPATEGQVKTAKVRPAARVEGTPGRASNSDKEAAKREGQQRARSGEVRGRVWARSPMAGVYGDAAGTGGEDLTGVLLR